MDITSLSFVLLTIVSIFIFYLLNIKYRGIYLVLLSCMFIASYNYSLLLYILIYTVINFYLGLKISEARSKKAIFRLGIIINLAQLLILRYASFAIDPVLSFLQLDLHIAKLSEIIIPIGISYFTLQSIGYLVNIKMGWEKPERNSIDFFLYIAFFPKFLSGPIERSNHFLPQLKKDLSFRESQVEEGLVIALLGLFKKVAIANRLAPYVLNAYANLDAFNGDTLWVILLLGPLYLYFDFSGYTDIAVGFAKAFGINLLPNFNRPFFAENVTTFWKRFHMSLSLWFNDYVFRQASFRYRKWGIYASIFGLLVTWTLFGIWHGAGWNFMVLGFIQALAITYEFLTKKWRSWIFSKLPSIFRIWLGRILTYLFYSGSLVFFFSKDINSSLIFFTKLSDLNGNLMLGPMSRAPYPVFIYIPILLYLEFLANDHKETYLKLESFWTHNNTKRTLFRWTVYSLMIILILIVGDEGKQFIYVNF